MGNRPTGVTIIAALEIIIGILYAIIGLGAAALGDYMSGVYGALGGIVSGVFLILALISFAICWGYLTGKGWARILGLIMAALGALFGLLTYPAGLIDLIINGVIIYYLTRPNVVDWFSGRMPTAAAPPPPPPPA
jgi:hypothetical protein